MAHFLIAAQHREDSPFNQLTDHTAVWEALTALDEEMRDAGVFVFSRGLEPPDAAVTFSANAAGEVVAMPGPYGPTTLAGMWIIDCEPGEAEAWAARCASAHLCDVELRPFQTHVSEQL